MDKATRSAGVVKLVIWSVVAVVLTAILAGAIVSGSSGVISFGNVISFGSYIYDDPDSYGLGNAEYTENVEIVDVSWLAGNVNIVTWDGNTFKVEESGEIDNDGEKMRSRVQNGKLSVKFARSGSNMSAKNVSPKELTVYIPVSMSASVKKLAVTAASANITVDGGKSAFTIGEINIDSASGEVSVKCLSTSKVDIDTAGGDVYLEGSFGNVDIDAASADVEIKGSVEKIEVDALSGRVEIDGEIAECEVGAVSSVVKIKTYATAPSSLDVETISGDVELIIPKTDSGFVARLESFSGKMICNGTKGGFYKLGAGSAEYDFESLSGNVRITAE